MKDLTVLVLSVFDNKTYVVPITADLSDSFSVTDAAEKAYYCLTKDVETEADSEAAASLWVDDGCIISAIIDGHPAAVSDLFFGVAGMCENLRKKTERPTASHAAFAATYGKGGAK